MFKGIAHTAIKVSDMKASLAYYCDLAGLTSAFSLKDANDNPWIEYLKVAPDQFVELFYDGTAPLTPAYAGDRIGYHHFCFETKDIHGVCKRMFAAGLLKSDEPGVGKDDNLNCWTHDPDGNAVEFVQYNPASPLVKGEETPGKGIAHVAFVAKDMEKTLAFYKDIMGFEQIFSLEQNGNPWLIYLKVRAGQIIELFYDGKVAVPYDGNRAGFAHLCIEVTDIHAAVAQMEKHGVTIDIPAKQGTDLNFQAWVKDPDGNKIELMQIDPNSPQAKS